MSTADRRRRRQAGFTLVEAVFCLPIVVLLALVCEQTLYTLTDSERGTEAFRRATERGQRVSQEVFHLVGASRRLLPRDAVGAGYLAALDLGDRTLLAGAGCPSWTSRVRSDRTRRTTRAPGTSCSSCASRTRWSASPTRPRGRPA